MEIFCEIPRSWHCSRVNIVLNLGSLSLMTHEGSPNQLKTCLRYSWAVPSAVTSSLQGINTDAFIQLWSVMVRMELHPFDSGSFVIKSKAIVSNGNTSGQG